MSALNFVNTLFSPHYDFEPKRKPGLKKIMQKTSGISIVLENCCAMEIIDDKYRIINSKKTAKAYKVYWKKGEFHEDIIEQEKEMKSLSELTKK